MDALHQPLQFIVDGQKQQGRNRQALCQTHQTFPFDQGRNKALPIGHQHVGQALEPGGAGFSEGSPWQLQTQALELKTVVVDPIPENTPLAPMLAVAKPPGGTAQFIPHQPPQALNQPGAHNRLGSFNKSGLFVFQPLANGHQATSHGRSQLGVKAANLGHAIDRPKQETHHQGCNNPHQGIQGAIENIDPIESRITCNQKQHRTHQNCNRKAGLPAQKS